MATRLDGKLVAEAVREGLRARIEALKTRGITPCLTVTLVGDDPASHILSLIHISEPTRPY